jgi:hypothetical protein
MAKDLFLEAIRVIALKSYVESIGENDKDCAYISDSLGAVLHDICHTALTEAADFKSNRGLLPGMPEKGDKPVKKELIDFMKDADAFLKVGKKSLPQQMADAVRIPIALGYYLMMPDEICTIILAKGGEDEDDESLEKYITKAFDVNANRSKAIQSLIPAENDFHRGLIRWYGVFYSMYEILREASNATIARISEQMPAKASAHLSDTTDPATGVNRAHNRSLALSNEMLDILSEFSQKDKKLEIASGVKTSLIDRVLLHLETVIQMKAKADKNRLSLQIAPFTSVEPADNSDTGFEQLQRAYDILTKLKESGDAGQLIAKSSHEIGPASEFTEIAPSMLSFISMYDPLHLTDSFKPKGEVDKTLVDGLKPTSFETFMAKEFRWPSDARLRKKGNVNRVKDGKFYIESSVTPKSESTFLGDLFGKSEEALEDARKYVRTQNIIDGKESGSELSLEELDADDEAKSIKEYIRTKKDWLNSIAEKYGIDIPNELKAWEQMVALVGNAQSYPLDTNLFVRAVSASVTDDLEDLAEKEENDYSVSDILANNTKSVSIDGIGDVTVFVFPSKASLLKYKDLMAEKRQLSPEGKFSTLIESKSFVEEITRVERLTDAQKRANEKEAKKAHDELQKRLLARYQETESNRSEAALEWLKGLSEDEKKEFLKNVQGRSSSADAQERAKRRFASLPEETQEQLLPGTSLATKRVLLIPMFAKNDREEHPVEAPLLTGAVIRKFFEVSNLNDPAENTVRLAGNDVVAEDDSDYVNAAKSFMQAVSNPDLSVDDIKDILETETTPLPFSAKLYFAAMATAKSIEEFNAGNAEIANADPTIGASDLNDASENAVAAFRSPLYQGTQTGRKEARYTKVTFINSSGEEQTKQVDITHVPAEYSELVKGDAFTNPEVPADLLTQAMKFHAERDAARELFIFTYHKLLALRGMIKSKDTPADMSGINKVLNWIRSEHVGGMRGAVENLYGTFDSYKKTLYGALDTVRGKREEAGNAPMVYENFFYSIAAKESVTNEDTTRIQSDHNFAQTIQQLAAIVMPALGEKSSPDTQIKSMKSIPKDERDEWIRGFKELYKYTSVLSKTDKKAVEVSIPVGRSGKTVEKKIGTIFDTLSKVSTAAQDLAPKHVELSLGEKNHDLMRAFLNAILRYFDYYFAMADETLDDNFESLSSSKTQGFEDGFVPNPSDWTGEPLVGKDGLPTVSEEGKKEGTPLLDWGVRRKDFKKEILNSKETLPNMDRISDEIDTCLNAFEKKFKSPEALQKMKDALTNPPEAEVKKVVDDYSPTRNVPESIVSDIEKAIEELKPAAVFHLVKLNTPEEEFDALTLGESLHTGYDPYDDTHRERMELEKKFSEMKMDLDNANVELAKMNALAKKPNSGVSAEDIKEKRREVHRLDVAVKQMSARHRLEDKKETEHTARQLMARPGTIPLEDRDAVAWAARGDNMSLLKGTSDKLTLEQQKQLSAAFASLSDFSVTRDGAKAFSGMKPNEVAKPFGQYEIPMRRILHAWREAIVSTQDAIYEDGKKLDEAQKNDPTKVPELREKIEANQEALRDLEVFTLFIENSDPNDMAPQKESLMTELKAVVKDLGEFVLHSYDRADISEEAKDEMIAEVDASISSLADRFGASKQALLKKAVLLASKMIFSEGRLVAKELNYVKDLLGVENTEGWETSDELEAIPEHIRNDELPDDPKNPKPIIKPRKSVSGEAKPSSADVKVVGTERERLLDRAKKRGFKEDPEYLLRRVKKKGLVTEDSTPEEIQEAIDKEVENVIAKMKQEVMREGMQEDQLSNLDGIAYRPKKNVPLNPFQKLLQQKTRR